MNFNQLSYWPGLLVLFILFITILIVIEKRFFKFIKTYWFYDRSVFSYLATSLYILGFAGLMLSLLDIRGPEEKIKTSVPEDRTIILMDTSASMLAEDVKPSRLQKAALIAKHFARKAAGHQISVVAFAEMSKKIVPFTNDLDLIDARLDSIKNLRNHYGSSALSLAIQESLQYFREANGEVRGNILVLTDGEETAEGIQLKIPKDVHVALVGIGTENGGRIPLDDGRGFRFGYKKDRGRDVITKLNEKFFKEVTADIPSSRYWLANSYSLPSEEILAFFQGEKIKSLNQQDMVIKPVLMEWIVIPSLLFLFLAYVLKSIRIFSLGLLLIILPVHAQEDKNIELSQEVITKMDELQRGELTQLEKLKLADELHKSGAKEEALSLYQENLPSEIDKGIPPEAYLNYGTALLEKGEVGKGLSVYKKLSDSLPDSAESSRIKEVMDKNIVTFFQEQKKKEQKKKQQNKNQDKKDQQNKDNNQSGQDQQKNQQSGNDKQQKKDDQEGDQDKKDNKKNEPKDKGEEKKENKSDAEKSQEGNEEQPKLPPRKIPAKLKQLMSDDRQLQMKMIEMGTRDLNRRKSRKSKDW